MQGSSLPLLGIAVAYLILASQFNSFLHPLTVLAILPLSVVGALIALFLANSLNIFSMIGTPSHGIVKKNSSFCRRDPVGHRWLARQPPCCARACPAPSIS